VSGKRAWQQRSLQADGAALLVATVLARGSVLIVQVLVAQMLGPADFAFYVTCAVIGAIVYSIADLGLAQSIVVAAGGDYGLAARAASQLRATSLLGAAGSMVIGLAAVWLFDGIEDVARGVAAATILLTYALQSFSTFVRSPLLAGAHVLSDSTMMVRERLLALAGSAIGILVGGGLAAAGAGGLVGTTVGLLISLRRLRRGAATGSVIWNRSAVVYGLRFVAALSATMVYARLDYLIIVRLLPTPEAAAYAAAYTLVVAASLIPIALMRAATVHYALHPAEAMRGHLRATLATGVVGGLTIAVSGPFVVRIGFGLDHNQLQLVTWVLGAAFVLMAFNSKLMVVESYSGHERTLVKLLWSAGIVNVAACLLLIPRIGIAGGAVATLATEAYIAVAWPVIRARRASASKSQQSLRMMWGPSVDSAHDLADR
jgi:O-antigen/teichoic acid export membrane protein